MRNIFAKIILPICLLINNGIALASNNLCIALTNVNELPVEFSALIDPGYNYTVKPGNSATLSGDHMTGACIRPDKNDCVVSVLILDGTYQQYEFIDHLSPGSRIIYKNLHHYEIDKNANIHCGS